LHDPEKREGRAGPGLPFARFWIIDGVANRGAFMSHRLAVLLSSVLVSGLLATACGAPSSDDGSGTTVRRGPPATAAAKATPAPASEPQSADSGGAFDCGQYVGQGTDIMSLPAAYLFIGAHPMCAEPAKVKEFCGWLATRDGFVKTQEVNQNGAEAGEIAKTMPEEARGTYLAHFPKQVFEQALQKCGLNREQQRSRLVADAEAAIAAGPTDKTGADVAFFVNEAPERAEPLWKHECDGHYIQKTVGEGVEWRFTGGKAAYAGFCLATLADDTRKVQFKAPSTSKH
jgi:hypothetical protein